ncbi:MAG TPA: metal-dependent hydrolase [Terriglobia bacterium]|nr:metal-dependent hydrolase [Terriglobia bacterium]
MDNLTHSLTALALSQAGLNRKTRFATLTLIAGANLPDIDLVATFSGGATYLKYHRGITHSILGAAILATALGALVYFLGRKAPPAKKSGPPLDLRWLIGISWIAVASHVLMDFTNSYGIRPFLPFSGRWYAWDIMPIIDILLWALLILGLALPPLFRLISEEVGAAKTKPRGGAIFALCSMLVLWGARDLAHRRVIGFLDSHVYGQENPVKLGAFPSSVNPFSWNGVVETDTAFYLLPASALDSDVDAEHATVLHKPDPSPALAAASKTRTCQIFLDFARFPWPNIDDTDNGFFVSIQDLRFASSSNQRRGFVVEIELDKNLSVLSESFSFLAKSRP